MKRIAIIGTHGSGKTVMLAGLGHKFAMPDSKGFFLEPNTLETASYVRRQYGKLLKGEWPVATGTDVMDVLSWTLKKKRGRSKPVSVSEVTCLDFAGEVYLAAFGGVRNRAVDVHQVSALIDYVMSASSIVILVNLRDAITNNPDDEKATTTEYATLQMLNAIFNDWPPDTPRPNIIIALSQADAFEDTIKECGGAKKTFEKYLPMIANSYGWLDVIAVKTVDKTDISDDGEIIPANGFTLAGLDPLMEWISNPPFRLSQFFSDLRTRCSKIITKRPSLRASQYSSASQSRAKKIFALLMLGEIGTFCAIMHASGLLRFVLWGIFAIITCCGCGYHNARIMTNDSDKTFIPYDKYMQWLGWTAFVLTLGRFLWWIA